jgi:hypothetical protein
MGRKEHLKVNNLSKDGLDLMTRTFVVASMVNLIGSSEVKDLTSRMFYLSLTKHYHLVMQAPVRSHAALLVPASSGSGTTAGAKSGAP